MQPDSILTTRERTVNTSTAALTRLTRRVRSITMLVCEHLGGYILVSYVAEHVFCNEVKRSYPIIRKKVLQQQIPGSSSFATKIQKYYLVQ